LRALILTVIPGVEVVQGQANYVVEPAGPDFIVFWPLRRERLATNYEGGWQGVAAPTAIQASASTDLVIQFDVHGPASGDNVQILSTLFRSDFSSAVGGLYTSDPLQVPFQNAEGLFENRWVVEIHVQVNPVVSYPMDFADALKAAIIEATSPE
jgi:hypothetical protein